MLKRCILKQENTITIYCGTFIPQYEDDGKRKKLMKSITFYDNGNIASMVLQNITNVNTKLGVIPAEMITFYESGAVKRIFPSFGTVTGFWTEKDEYLISPELKLDLPSGVFHNKVINVSLYETGDLKSITLWSKDAIVIKTLTGEIQTRVGFCLYPNGKIKSVEPFRGVRIDTKIGTITASDPDALAIDGDNNSLVFSEDGSILSLLTATTQVTVTSHGETNIHTSSFKKSDYFDDRLAVEPMKISFSNDFVQFGKRKQKTTDASYKISECLFKIETLDTQDCFNTCEECL